MDKTLKNSGYLAFIALLICVAAIHFPFLNKAFHIDDTLFYYTAKQILSNPALPYSFQVNWSGYTQKTYDFFSNPPGISYYIALVISFFGIGEKCIHASYILFSLISVFSMYFLAKRFTEFPLASALFLILSPIYMIVAHTIMPDLPLVAFFLLAITLFVYGYDRQNILLLVLSGIAASFAVMLRYSGLSLIPVFFLYYLLHFKASKKWGVLTLLFPTITFITWNFFTKAVYGSFHFLTQLTFQNYMSKMMLKDIISYLMVDPSYLGGGRILYLIANLSYLGGGSLFPLLFLAPAISKRKMDKIIFFSLGLCIFSAAFYFRRTLKYDYLHALLVGVFLFCVVYFLFSSLKKLLAILFARRKMPADEIFLLSWVFVILLIHSSGIHTAAKYMIVAIPPLIMLVMKNGCWIEFKVINRNTMIYTMLFLTGLIGFATAIADYEFAGTNRKIADYCANNIKVGENNTVWILGHWGFQYYMEKKGFKPYEQYSNEPKKGDLLIFSSLAWPQYVNKKLASRVVLYDKIHYLGKIPIRIMHNRYGKHANFYAFSNYGIIYGILPFSISMYPIDEFIIYQVIKD